jgi:hypothetical protein
VIARAMVVPPSALCITSRFGRGGRLPKLLACVTARRLFQ